MRQAIGGGALASRIQATAQEKWGLHRRRHFRLPFVFSVSVTPPSVANSTPFASSAARTALAVRTSRSSPRSSRTIALVETSAASARSRTSSFRIMRAARHCAGVISACLSRLCRGYVLIGGRDGQFGQKTGARPSQPLTGSRTDAGPSGSNYERTGHCSANCGPCGPGGGLGGASWRGPSGWRGRRDGDEREQCTALHANIR
jgi:hypothetical protein